MNGNLTSADEEFNEPHVRSVPNLRLVRNHIPLKVKSEGFASKLERAFEDMKLRDEDMDKIIKKAITRNTPETKMQELLPLPADERADEE